MNLLEKIVAQKKEEIKDLKIRYNLSDFKGFDTFDKPCLSFYDSLNNRDKISLIAEVKKASPSKGVIRLNFDHIEIAQAYSDYGASAISVLTDEVFFKGSAKYLADISKIKKIPLLRKEFIIDVFQIYEAKILGADAILLICEILEPNQIKEFTLVALELGMQVLLELHSEDQLEKIDFGLNKIIGLNNRDLFTFAVDINRTIELSNKIPVENLIVAESGISTEANIEVLKQSRINAVLVGEYFMRQNNIAEAVKTFSSWLGKN